MRRAVLVLLSIIMLVMVYIPGCTLVQEKNRAPIAVFSATPKSINVGETVEFTANESRDKDGKIVKYSWAFGDGTYSLEKYTTHTYEKGGNFTAELIVKDDAGAVDRTNTTIHVNEWPVADGRASKDPAKINEVIQFDAEDSKDKDGKIIDYYWDFGDGTGEFTGKEPTHKYTKIGTYTINLTVKDNDKASAQTQFKIKVIKRNFKVLWEEDTRVLTTFSEYTSENETTNKTYKVNAANLTMLELNMTWNDLIPVIGPANDLFSFSASSPDKTCKKGETTTEMIVHKFKIDEVPDTINLESDSIEAVRAQISAQYTSAKGNGEYFLSIYCSDAGDWWVNSTLTDIDKGNDWEVQLIAYYYRANIVEIG